VNYIDSILIKLADPAQRAALFDSTSLEQMAAGAYDAVFDELRLGFSIAPVATLEGSWSPTGGAERTEARLFISGLGSAGSIRVDALWRGQIIARSSMPVDRITTVKSKPTVWSTIDGEIIAALGNLPADPVALEQQRRTRLLDRIRTGFNHPEAVTDAMLDKWLRSVGASSVSQLMTQFKGTVESESVQVTFTPGPDPGKSPKALPIVAAVLIRDVGFSLAELLADSKAIKEQLEPLGFAAPASPALRTRQHNMVVWVVPGAVFDDAAWPDAGGGLAGQPLRDSRRSLAGKWLGNEGIGLVVTN